MQFRLAAAVVEPEFGPGFDCVHLVSEPVVVSASVKRRTLQYQT